MKEKVGQKVNVAVDLGCLAAFSVWNQQEQWTGTGLCFFPSLACKYNSFDSNLHQWMQQHCIRSQDTISLASQEVNALIVSSPQAENQIKILFPASWELTNTNCS